MASLVDCTAVLLCTAVGSQKRFLGCGYASTSCGRSHPEQHAMTFYGLTGYVMCCCLFGWHDRLGHGLRMNLNDAALGNNTVQANFSSLADHQGLLP